MELLFAFCCIVGFLVYAWVSAPPPAKLAPTRAFVFFNIVSFAIGTKAVNTINVALQLQDAHGVNIAGVASFYAYLSDNADGSTLTATATTSTLAVQTNGVILDTPVTEKEIHCITDATGRFDVNIIQTAGGTNYYLVVIMPDGSTQVSGKIAF